MANRIIDLLDPQVKARDIRAVRAELDRIQKENDDGLLIAEDTVQTAKNPHSALHSYFEWDDTKAGHQHRLAQARSLIRCIAVYEPDDVEEKRIPKYVSLRPDRSRPQGGYRKTAEVLSNKQLLAELEETVKKDIDAVLRRYEMLKELCAKVRRAAGIDNKKKRR